MKQNLEGAKTILEIFDPERIKSFVNLTREELELKHNKEMNKVKEELKTNYDDIIRSTKEEGKILTELYLNGFISVLVTLPYWEREEIIKVSNYVNDNDKKKLYSIIEKTKDTYQPVVSDWFKKFIEASFIPKKTLAELTKPVKPQPRN